MTPTSPPDLVLLLRGAADRSQDLLGGRTPLTYAELPNLRRLTRRGPVRPFQAAPEGHSVHAGGDLFPAFGVSAFPGKDLPVAAADWEGAGREARAAYIHADPVRLAVTPQAALLTDPEELDLSTAEAGDLVSVLNQELFGVEGWRLEALAPGSWVLEMPEPPELRTVPLEGWIGAEASGGLPAGGDRAVWHRLVNEAQMVLAAHPVNRRRREEGRPEVTSLWPWGAGARPAAGSTPWAGAGGKAHALLGLARWTGVPYLGGIPSFQGILEAAEEGGPVLAVADRPRAAGARGDLGAKIRALEALDEGWLGALDQALAEGRLKRAWVVLGPEAPVGIRTAEPAPPCPVVLCRSGRLFPWRRPRDVGEAGLSGKSVGWPDILGYPVA